MMALGIGLFIVALAATWLATGLVIRLLNRQSILDHPTNRSSHTVPTPRGGGLAVVPVVVVTWLISVWILGDKSPGPSVLWVLAGGVLLGWVSWRDDVHGLPVIRRLAVHILVVALVLFSAEFSASFTLGLLPLWLEYLLVAFLLLWFLNLFNFMDGIDGISGIETTCVGLGCAGVAWASGSHEWIGVLGLSIAGAGIGFLRWNWQPAKIFLGDVGSVPLGFMLAWLLLALAAEGAWAAALILPLYYLGDATITIIRRATRGERIWEAHREHFYQQAARRDGGHARVSIAVAMTNLVLIGLAVWSLDNPLPAVAAAVLVVALFLIYLAKSGRPAQ